MMLFVPGLWWHKFTPLCVAFIVPCNWQGSAHKTLRKWPREGTCVCHMQRSRQVGFKRMSLLGGGSSQVKRARVQGGGKIALRQKERWKFREKLKTREKYGSGEAHAGLWLLFPGTDVSTIDSEEWDYNWELNLNSESTKSYMSSEILEAIENQLLIR